jgi:hypothetical protein
MMRTLIAGIIFLAGTSAANADVVRCNVTDRSHRLMPEWIEYELRDRDTIVEIRDSVGERFGVGWVRGEVTENTAQRFSLMWDNGMIPKQDEWWNAGRVVTHLTILADGNILVTGVPAFGLNHNIRYSGRAVCE